MPLEIEDLRFLAREMKKCKKLSTQGCITLGKILQIKRDMGDKDEETLEEIKTLKV